MPDPYTYPGTNILINKFDIRDGQLLTEKENDLVYINLVTAEQYLSGKEFTVDLLKSYIIICLEIFMSGPDNLEQSISGRQSVY